MFGTNSHAQSVLVKKKSASELNWKFIKVALFGWVVAVVEVGLRRPKGTTTNNKSSTTVVAEE